MRRSLLIAAIVSSSSIAVAIGCQQEDPRPPVSDGPYSATDAGANADGSNTQSDSGSKLDAGYLPDGSVLPPIALPYAASGVTADGDTAYVIAGDRYVDGGSISVILKIDPSGAMTTLRTEAQTAAFPVKVGNTLAYVRWTALAYDVVALDLDHTDQDPTPLMQDTSVESLSVVGTTLYVLHRVDGNSSAIDMIPLGGSPTPVVTIAGDYFSGALSIDSSNFYIGLAGGTTGGLFSAPLDGGAAKQIASGGPNPVDDVAVGSGKIVYERDLGSMSNLYTLPVDGGSPTTIATSTFTSTYPFVLADGNIYFCGNDGHSPNVSQVPIDSDTNPVPGFVSYLKNDPGGILDEMFAVGATEIFVANGDEIDRIVR